MMRCNRVMNMEPSGCAVVRSGEVTAEVCLSNKKRKVIPSSDVVLLPDEIITEVLLRLPVKSIFRFRAVCRSWAALLLSEEFCSLHMAMADVKPSPPKLLLVSPTSNFDSTAVYSSSLLDHNKDDLLFTLDYARGNFVDVVPASCHGLTLIYDAILPAYYVCNAATRAVTRLPPCSDVAYATAGLGFDAGTRKYKVVRLFQGRGYEKQIFNCEIYTLGGEEGDHWRPVAGGVPFRFCNFVQSAVWHAVCRKTPPVFVDGFLHWLMEPSFFAKMPGAAIISFSLTNETFSWVRSPSFAVSGAHLIELDCHLCMVRDLRKGLSAGSMLEIWKIKDYSSGGWSLNYRIDLLGHMSRDFVEPQVVKVIGSFGNSKSSKRIIIATSKHKVFAYDPLSETLETIHSTMEIHASRQIEPSDTRFSLFRESLVPVHKTKEDIALSSPLAKAASEILLRLPAKSVVKFKLVCKQWLRLIKSESFVHAFFLHKNMNKRLKIMLVGKGTGQPGFSFIHLNNWVQEVSNKGVLLDTKVVCSKPCHGLNLVSTDKGDYLYNPCTGFLRVCVNQRPHMHQTCKVPIDGAQQGDHPFSVGNKNVGLGFDPLFQEHIIVEIFYSLKDYEFRRYHLTCSLWSCSSRRLQQLPPPALPVNDMPPAYLEGMLYWMSEPRLGQSHKRAIVSFNIATKMFDIIPCPSCIAKCDSNSPCLAYVVELERVLCAVLANLAVNELDVWKWELGQWDRAYTIYLNSWPDYFLGTNIVVPLAVDPTDGRVLLSTGRKLGLYNPLTQAIENSFELDQVPNFTRKELKSCLGVHTECSTKCKHVGSKAPLWKPSLDRCEYFAQRSSAPLRKDLSHSRGQSKEELNRMSKLMPLVPMLYEESLAYYPGPVKARVLK